MLTIADSDNLTVKVNTDHNFMYLKLDGYFNEDDAAHAAQKVIDGVTNLKPGFIIINDMANFKPAKQEAAAHIKTAQQKVHAKGVGKVIRVVPESVITKMQFEQSQKEANADYETHYVSSKEEAKALLRKG
jgi:hypothetical protein